MDQPGKELVERARRKDAGAFASLISRYERVALSVAYGVVGDAAAAGDVTQDAFVRAWERLADLREPERFGTWLCGIVRNLAVDCLRRQKPAQSLGTDEPASEERWTHNPVDEIGRRESRARVAAALASLDEISRPVVVLRYYEGLSSKQIGELLEISPQAVDMRLSRARKQLRFLLGDLASEPNDIRQEQSK
ncbi:MAG TPA: sigma-70 family RNA polymerase sigma factor [Tepidisphaeraceae bacterium]|nr:sigma-70 family RNA polymerase sigma factor [Tepidisphaeraceae bacterium]